MWPSPNVTACLPPPYPPPKLQSVAPADDEIFSAAWNALRFPGTRHSVPDALTPVRGIFPATAALCQALLGSGRSLWVYHSDRSLLHQWCLWNTEGLLAPSPEKADFTLVTRSSRMPALYHLNIGDGCDPATSTTLLIQVPALDPGGDFLWDPKKKSVSPQEGVHGLPRSFWHQRVELQEMLPWGIDIFFIHEYSFVALPRSVSVSAPMPD